MTYRELWRVEVRHEGLNKYREIKGPDRWVVDERAAAQRAQWDEQWARRVDVEATRSHKLQIAFGKEQAKHEAAERTEAATENIRSMKELLTDGLPHLAEPLWSSLKQYRGFSEPRPQPASRPADPDRPDPNAVIYKPRSDFMSTFLPSRQRRFKIEAEKQFATDLRCWQEIVTANADLRNYADLADVQALKTWEEARSRFTTAQVKHNTAISVREQRAESGQPDGILDALQTALERQTFPECISKNFDLDFAIESQSAVIDFNLPAPSDIETLKEVKYIAARDDFSEKHLSDAELARLYDGLLYQATLLTIATIFSADSSKKLERVTFNGWVDYVVASTGLDERSCILSLGCNRKDLESIALDRVDPRECFKSLKGVAASKLIGLAAVAPLERPRNVDPRYIASQDVAAGMDSATNLAMIGWQDFEHLVRQVFEAEFKSPNSEVRVTQASRDGGVDAIVYDPDPIKGGKTIIQAKRYVHTVDVSSVRDLFGTVQHEGANRGILVTTSQFGPDARKFAQDKPIVLIDGGNLLHLLEKLGVKARIDLKEAKEALRSQNS